MSLPVSVERPSPASTTSTATSSRPAEYSKLVRGQDVWLSGGGERTRRSILRCIQCGESFRSLPELTVHMVHTRHYTNIVGGPPSSSTSGHVTSELSAAVGSTHGRKQHRTDHQHHVKTERFPTVTSRESMDNPMTSSSSPCRLMDDDDARKHPVARDYSDYDVTPHQSTNQSPSSPAQSLTGRQSTGASILLMVCELS